MATVKDLDSIRKKWEQENISILDNVAKTSHTGPNGEIYLLTFKWKKDMIKIVSNRRKMFDAPIVMEQ